MYSARTISRFVIDYVNSTDKTITNLHLQKILYFLQIENLGRSGELLFDDPIEKWKLGPVIPKVYHDYKMFGSNPIQVRRNFEFDSSEEIDFDSEMMIIEITERLINKSAFELVEITHKHEAWEKDKNKIMKGKSPTYTRDELYKAYQDGLGLNNEG